MRTCARLFRVQSGVWSILGENALFLEKGHVCDRCGGCYGEGGEWLSASFYPRRAGTFQIWIQIVLITI